MLHYLPLLINISSVNSHASQLRLDLLDPLLLLVGGGISEHQIHILERLYIVSEGSHHLIRARVQDRHTFP